MLELLFSGSTGKYITESGPGNKKLLAGDTVNGYFGPILTKDLFTADELINKFGLRGKGIIVDAPNLVWLKFVLNGKYLFFPTQALLNGISWLTLYNAGLAYGVDGSGTLTPSTGAVNQLALISKSEASKSWVMKTRLPEASVNASVASAGALDVQASEIGIILGRVITAYTWVTPANKWDNLVVGTNFTPDIAILSKTPLTTNTNTVGVGVKPTLLEAYSLPYTDVSATSCWLPILELTSSSGVTIGADPISQINYDNQSSSVLIDVTLGGTTKFTAAYPIAVETVKPLLSVITGVSDSLIPPVISPGLPSTKKLIL